MKKKNAIKSGLVFGVSMSVFFIVENLLLKKNTTSADVILSIGIGILAGVISGILFGFLMYYFLNSKMLKTSTKIETAAGETIIAESPANHYKGIEAVGGKLYLTNERLVFKSHKINFQNHELSMKLADIRDVKRYKSLGIVNNGLIITYENGNTEKFVVENAEAWFKRLEAKKS